MRLRAASGLCNVLAVLLCRMPPAMAQDDAGTAGLLVQQAQPAVQQRLGDVLEHAPANQAVPWDDEASGLSGVITAAPASFNGRPCRALRYTVRNGSQQVAVEGQRCREPDGAWVAGQVADRMVAAPVASPLIRDLQAALRRLAYYDGALDGTATPFFTRALLAFEHDEQVPPEAEPAPGLLELADAAIARIPAAGPCPADMPVADGASVACGSIR